MILDGLGRFAVDTHTRVLQVVGPQHERTAAVEHILARDNPQAMVSTDHGQDLFEGDPPKLQSALGRVAMQYQADQLMEHLKSRDASVCATSDLVHACTHTRQAVILTAKLSNKYNRLTPPEFVSWFRHFLQLPLLERLGNAEPRAGFDYDMEQCMGSHSTRDDDAWLDLHGSHDNSNCAPTSQGKHKGHTLLKWTISRFAKLVPGVEVKVEPKTSEILLNQFSDQECRSLFPKLPSVARAKQTQDMVDALEEVRRMPAGEEKDRKAAEVNGKMDELNIANNQEEKKAVRLDVYLQHDLDELLIDGTIVHPLTKAGRGPEAGRTWERINSDVKEVQEKPAAAVDRARKMKYKTYNPLLYVIKKQVIDGRRRKEPVFTPATITTFGELGPGCVVVQEWLAMRFKAATQAMGPRPDGSSLAALTGSFRAEFRMALMLTAVRRASAMQMASGLPKGCTKKSIGDSLALLEDMNT